ARVHYWKGDNAEATAAMERVLKETPKYADALVLMGDIQMAWDRPSEAHAFYQRAHEVDAATPGLEAKLRNAISPLRWRFDAGYSNDDYDGSRGPGEHSFFTQLGYRAHPRANVWVRQDYYNYFSKIDNGVGFGTAMVVAKPLVITSEVEV